MFEFTLDCNLNADITSVFDALSIPEMITQWCEPNNLRASQFIGEVKSGENFKIVMQSEDGFQQIVLGTYQEVVHCEKLSFTWRWEDTNEITKVAIDLSEKENNNTQLKLSQKGFKVKSEMVQQQFAWVDCLEKLSLCLPAYRELVANPTKSVMFSAAA